MTPGSLRARVLAYVRRHAGASCAEIAAGIGETTAFVSVALRQLRGMGKLTRAGNTQGTRWYLAGQL